MYLFLIWKNNKIELNKYLYHKNNNSLASQFLVNGFYEVPVNPNIQRTCFFEQKRIHKKFFNHKYPLIFSLTFKQISVTKRHTQSLKMSRSWGAASGCLPLSCLSLLRNFSLLRNHIYLLDTSILLTLQIVD